MQGTHLVNKKNPCTEHKWVRCGRGPEGQMRKWMKMVHSQPVRGPAGVSALRPEGRHVQLPMLEAWVSPISAAGKLSVAAS